MSCFFWFCVSTIVTSLWNCSKIKSKSIRQSAFTPPISYPVKPHQPRSQGTTSRSWWQPAGGGSRSVRLANVFVMRMLYVKLEWHWHLCLYRSSLFFNTDHMNISTSMIVRIYYAHQRGIFFAIEQPMTSVKASIL